MTGSIAWPFKQLALFTGEPHAFALVLDLDARIVLVNTLANQVTAIFHQLIKNDKNSENIYFTINK